MADAPDSKSGEGNLMRVRLPPPALLFIERTRMRSKVMGKGFSHVFFLGGEN